MKKYVLAMLTVLMIASLGYPDSSPEFQKLENAIKNAVPDGFIRNKGQSWDNRFYRKITFDRGGYETNRLIFSFDPNGKSFSERDLALDHKKLTIQERKALFNDGSKTGMSVIKVILKNNSGLFTITHRSLDGKAMSQTGIETLLSKVNLEILEK